VETAHYSVKHRMVRAVIVIVAALVLLAFVIRTAASL
jgi:hypothetical protein